MRIARLHARAAFPLVACAFLALTSCTPLGLQGPFPCYDGCGVKEKVCENPTVMALAHDLDHLEEHIDKYGSIVAKQPDVWGQARMTKHREEFEREMAKDLTAFKATLQGSISRTDQAYFADAFALSAAISGRQAGLFAPRPRVQVNNSTATSAGAGVEKPVDTLKPPDLPDQSATFDAFSATNFSRSAVRQGKQLGFAVTEGISLEPTIFEDQKARFLNHLNELRRINEGDDTADSPGYALNLVRIPVSVLPGKCTDKGYGAEVTMTMTPYLSEELLPTTFRNLVINDLVDQIGVPLTQLLNDPDYADVKRMTDEEYEAAYCGKVEGTLANELQKPGAQAKRRLPMAVRAAGVNTNPSVPLTGNEATAVAKAIKEHVAAIRTRSGHTRPAVPVTKLRRARLPFPPSQIPDVYSTGLAELVVRRAYQAFARDPSSKYPCDGKEEFVHLPSVQGYLQEELNAAYKFLANPLGCQLWAFCTPQLNDFLRARNVTEVEAMRKRFLAAANALAGAPEESCLGSKKETIALAWAIIVESALLNDQLIQDMREAGAAKGCGCAPPAPLPYFLPDPPPEARQAFNAYVQCRWPIHVFALDPVTEQQNLADTYSARREMQLAMSLAFVSGQISARSMMRYARRIEIDMETIALNNTAVGFSHGNETFGWRFYPRFQTPDIESNAKVFFRDLLIGGPSQEALLRQRHLEPGMRECVAIVIMPSFVPYATMEVSSNWFQLTNPKCKELTSADAMRLSRSVKAIQNCAGKVGDSECYRDGDLQRLLVKAQQLEARLPLQTMQVQVPFENTLGGFAMFNTGVTDLAPELYGWYGASQVRLADKTAIFLVGNHFSVHQTRVVAGGLDVPSDSAADMEMLSRQVVKVVIPAGAVTHKDGDRQYVDVYIATPYGVTAPLMIPVCVAEEKKPAGGFVWATPSFRVAYLDNDTLGIKLPTGKPPCDPLKLVVQSDTTAPLANKGEASVTLALAAPFDNQRPILLTKVPYADGTLTIDGENLQKVLIDRFGRTFGPGGTNPPPDLSVADTTVQLIEAGGQPIPGFHKAANALTITWVKQGQE